MTVTMKPRSFRATLDWALAAKPGDKLVYHRGEPLSNFQKQHNYPDAVWGVRHCYNQGLVELVTKREGTDFHYWAIRREVVSPPKPAYSREGEPVHLFAIPHRFLKTDD